MTLARTAAVAAHTERVRQAGGKRTSVDLTAAALVHLAALRSTGNSTSEVICAALAIAHGMHDARRIIATLTKLEN